MTLFYFGIVYLTYYFQTYKVYITIIEIKSKTPHKNTFQSTYLHNYCFCNDMKTKANHIVLKNRK